MPESIPTYRELLQRWKALRATRDCTVREVACVGVPRTLLCVDVGDPMLPAVHMSAGVHGDEPAGPLALLELVERDILNSRFSYRLWPCTNPTGLDAGTRASVDGIDINRTFGRGGSSPEAKAIIMANRNRKFVLAIDLHEDDDAEEFYCYEYGTRHLAPAFTSSVRRPDPAVESAAIGGLSLSLLLCRNAAESVMTFESPSRKDVSERVAMHVRAVQATFSRLIPPFVEKESSKPDLGKKAR